MKYNIAISGTFNVENYGDLMFPVIFKKAMEKRNLDFELFLFSPERSCKKALDETTTVYAISEIDKIHNEHPINAVIVGGGALVHYNKILVKFPQETQIVGYDIGESWYYPIEFAVRNNVPLLFNLPQIPFPFSESLKAATRAAFDCCDYISFRDDISKQYLLDIYENNPPQIDVYPDSVCCISDLIPLEELEKLKHDVLSFDDKYAVIQFNPQKPQADDQYLIEIINKLRTQGLKVVLLPIGYTHNDDFVLEQFNTENNLDCELITQKLNIMETAAVLSGCEIYIGSSFHGAITAIAYGKKAISYNYIFPKNKNQEIFKMYGVSDFVVDNAKDALNLLNDLCDGKINFNPKTDEVLSQLNKYFDNLLSMIKNNQSTEHDYQEFIKPLIKVLPELSKLDREKVKLITDIDSQKEYSTKLESIINQHLEHISNLEKYCNDLEKNNAAQNEYIKSLESTLHSTQEQLNQINTSYQLIKNTFLVRVLLFIKRLFSKK